MKPVVRRSIQDETGDRCVDIRQWADGSCDWVECRRDPEDGFGWRPLGPARGCFADPDAALAAMRRDVGWVTA